MLKKTFLAVCFCFVSAFLFAQTPLTVALWPNGVPESNGLSGPERLENNFLLNISIPEMSIYFAKPELNSGVAVLICPGGSYMGQAVVHEGSDMAMWLAEQGITGIVLKYRLPNGHPAIPLKDAQQALRIIRQRAAEWKLLPSKIGICGFSAGGHLASTVGTHFETKPACPVSSKSCQQPDTTNVRPDFMILYYPVISMQDGLTHEGSRFNMFGTTCSKDSIDFYSNELHVTTATPPTLLMLSSDDTVVLPQNSLLFKQALLDKGVSTTMYTFSSGNHGWGFKQDFSFQDMMQKLLKNWLNAQLHPTKMQ